MPEERKDDHMHLRRLEEVEQGIKSWPPASTPL
jgi:hypothetical protein